MNYIDIDLSSGTIQVDSSINITPFTIQSISKIIRMRKATQHKTRHSEIDYCFAGMGIEFAVFTVATSAGQPGKGAFNNPRFALDLKAFGEVGTPDDAPVE